MKVQKSIALSLASVGLALSAPACSSAPGAAAEEVATESEATAVAPRPDWAKVCASAPKAFVTRRGQWMIPIFGGGGLFGAPLRIIGYKKEFSVCKIVLGTHGHWTGAAQKDTLTDEETNFCAHTWVPVSSPNAAPEYDKLETAVLDELQPDQPSPGGLFQDPFYADCSGKTTPVNLDDPAEKAKTPVTYVHMPDNSACKDAQGGHCENETVHPYILMPQCPSCCTVTEDKIIAVIPSGPGDRAGVMNGQAGYAVVPRVAADGTVVGYSSVKVDPDSAVGTTYVMSIPPADKGKLKPGQYGIGAD